ncbi:MAG: hypothetical protein K0Q72_5031 [Armatimonadetes bacterium]|nr:hypothetical protein [Armatimonadota bacterium]
MPILSERDDKRKPKAGRRLRWLTVALLTALFPVLLAGLLLLIAWISPVQLTVGSYRFECRWQSYPGTGDPIAVVHPEGIGFEAIVGSGHHFCFTSLKPDPGNWGGVGSTNWFSTRADRPE